MKCFVCSKSNINVIDGSVDLHKKILISIINKTGMSDDWEIEQ